MKKKYLLQFVSHFLSLTLSIDSRRKAFPNEMGWAWEGESGVRERDDRARELSEREQNNGAGRERAERQSIE
jgi:hypothetical protein